MRAADAPRRPAAPFSVALDRDLFAGSQNLRIGHALEALARFALQIYGRSHVKTPQL